MERRRGRGHGSGLVVAAGIAMVGFWVVGGGAGAGAVEEPLPVVAIVAVDDGVIRQTSVNCNSRSAAIGRGEFEVRRTGPTATDLTVTYEIQSGDTGDFDPPSGSVTIPAGSETESILVSPRFVERPAPVHVHRSAILTGVLVDGAGYNVGGEGSATISLRFDVDIEPCVPPTTPPTNPAGPTDAGTAVDPVAQPTATGTPTLPATGNPATLPFTGSPFTTALAGVGSTLVALGGFGLRYAHPRERRRRPRI